VSGRRAPAVLLLAAFLVLIGLFHALTLRPGHDWGDDFAQYIHHAKNIALGIDYNRTGYLWNPSFPMLGPQTYPPVFPLILAPVYAVAGLDLTAMKLVVVLFFVAAILMTFLVFRGMLRGYELAVLLPLLGLNPYFWRLKDNVLSDLPFFFFVYLALFLFQRRPEPGRLDARAVAHAVACGVVCYLAYGTRSLGAILIPSLLLTDWIRWRRITLASVVSTIVFAALAIAQAAVSHHDTSYTSILSLDPRRIATNGWEYARYLSGLWDNVWWKHADIVLTLLAAALAVAGIWGRLRSGASVLEIFAVLYGLAILPWIATQGRYLVPLMPLYLAYAILALRSLSIRWPRFAGGASMVLLALACVGFASVYGSTSWRRPPEGVGTHNARAMFAAVSRMTEPGAVVIFQKPRALALFTDRQASGVQDAPPPELLRYLRRLGAAYVLLGPDDRVFLHQEALRNLITAFPDRFVAIYRNPEFALFRVRGLS